MGVPRNFLVLWYLRATRGDEESESVHGSSVVGETPGLFLLRGSCCWRSGWGGRGDGRIRWVWAGYGIAEDGGVLEDAAGVIGDGFDAGGVSRIGSADAAVVGAGGLVNVAAKMIEKAAEQQAGIGSKDGVIHGIQVQRAGRPQASRQQAVVAFVFEVELMGGTEGFTGDLPGADGVIADHDALAATAKNDVVALSALLPNGMGEIAVNVHVIVFHGTDAEEVIER